MHRRSKICVLEANLKNFGSDGVALVYLVQGPHLPRATKFPRGAKCGSFSFCIKGENFNSFAFVLDFTVLFRSCESTFLEKMSHFRNMQFTKKYAIFDFGLYMYIYNIQTDFNILPSSFSVHASLPAPISPHAPTMAYSHLKSNWKLFHSLMVSQHLWTFCA